MDQGRLLIFVLVLSGCGPSAPVGKYQCHARWDVSSDHPIRCDLVVFNVDTALEIMGSLSKFEGSLHYTSRLYLHESDCIQFYGDGTCQFVGMHWESGEVELGRSMGALVHELGHAWLKHYTDDWDYQHRWFQSAGINGLSEKFSRAKQVP